MRDSPQLDDEAQRLDDHDPCPAHREAFAIPRDDDGSELSYLAGNSLGLQPHAARAAVARELEAWARRGVDGWFDGPAPWLGMAERLRPPLARILGASIGEVAVMSTLTVDLHLLLATFYRPTADRFRILVEEDVFPSDGYAVASQVALHGFTPHEAVVRIAEADVVEAVERLGETVAVVLCGGVSYLSGRRHDIAAIARAAHAVGAVAGVDLAHAVGNVELVLAESDVDFAAWCSYKYLNGGPGAPAGIFVAARHAANPELPRLAGWWGTDPEARFRMEPTFAPRRDAAGWAVSTPSVLALAPLAPALALFDLVGMPALRARSERLTAYLAGLVDEIAAAHELRLLTPREPAARGAQLSIAVPAAASVAARLRREGVVCDHREPDVVRLAPAPLYNTFADCARAAAALARVVPAR